MKAVETLVESRIRCLLPERVPAQSVRFEFVGIRYLIDGDHVPRERCKRDTDAAQQAKKCQISMRGVYLRAKSNYLLSAIRWRKSDGGGQKATSGDRSKSSMAGRSSQKLSVRICEMKIGLVGYQGSGKSTLFEWLTGETPDPALAHTSQAAMATVTDPRVAPLCEIYSPKKVTQAALEIVDTPGLSRTHEGSAAKLATIREASCLIIVLDAFQSDAAAADLANFDDDLLIADLDIVSGRVTRLREQVKKPRPNRDELQKELAALEPLLEALEAGSQLRDLDLSPDQKKAIRSFQLFSEKPRLAIFNISDDEANPQQYLDKLPPGAAAVAVSLALQAELSRLSEEERRDFCEEMGVEVFDREGLIRQIMDVSGQMLFFTAGEKEVRTWMIRRGGTAVEAAGNIHTDLARGFIRAEVMRCQDLVELGSEREIKANGLLRQEHKEYVIEDGDILLIRHN